MNMTARRLQVRRAVARLGRTASRRVVAATSARPQLDEVASYPYPRKAPHPCIALGRAMPFDVGDKVVYPHHGAAVIERREERDVFGANREYLVLRLAYGDLT